MHGVCQKTNEMFTTVKLKTSHMDSLPLEVRRSPFFEISLGLAIFQGVENRRSDYLKVKASQHSWGDQSTLLALSS